MIYVLALTLLWLALTGQFTLGNVLLGLLLALVVRAVVRRPDQGATGAGWTERRLYHAFDLLAFFFWEVVVSGISIALEIVRPRMRLSPAVLAIPVRRYSPTGVMLLANLITMTPGTLSLHADEAEEVLYVHAMQVEDTDEFRAKVQNTFARRVWEVMV
jgi:multicomponent Na+:H+ antiporter subunit E